MAQYAAPDGPNVPRQDTPPLANISAMNIRRHRRQNDDQSLAILRKIAQTGWVETLRMSILLLVSRCPGTCLFLLGALLAGQGFLS